MTAAKVKPANDETGSSPAASIHAAAHLEVPRPLRLLLTAGWSLTESAGLPVAAYALAAWLDGRDAGMIAGLAAIWLTAVIRKVATGSVPSLLTISALVLTPVDSRSGQVSSRELPGNHTMRFPPATV